MKKGEGYSCSIGGKKGQKIIKLFDFAELRCSYLSREIAHQKGWNTKHPQNGGDFLEEQEIECYFPDSGLGKTKPDFLICKQYKPIIVEEVIKSILTATVY